MTKEINPEKMTIEEFFLQAITQEFRTMSDYSPQYMDLSAFLIEHGFIGAEYAPVFKHGEHAGEYEFTVLKPFVIWFNDWHDIRYTPRGFLTGEHLFEADDYQISEIHKRTNIMEIVPAPAPRRRPGPMK